MAHAYCMYGAYIACTTVGPEQATKEILMQAAIEPAFSVSSSELAWMSFSMSDAHLRKARFTKIFETRFWNAFAAIEGEENVPVSGLGSRMDVASCTVDLLQKLSGELGFRKLLDVGCGDLTWLRQIKFVHPITYIGACACTHLSSQAPMEEC